MPDEIRRLSEALARDPASPVYLQLGEALRRTGQLDLALKVALRGLERHPHEADAHDLLARVAVDRGELERAFDEWDVVRRLAPDHLGARKGMGYVLFKQGRFAEAQTYLSEAAELDAEDETVATALAMVRVRLRGNHGDHGDRRDQGDRGALELAVPVDPVAPVEPHDPLALFHDLTADGEQTALLLDSTGLVMAGTYTTYDGRDVAQEVGAELSGVSDEARRAMRHLGLGDWSSLTVETDAAVVAMAPMRDDALLLVAASKAMPLGLVHRVLDRCAARASQWLGRNGS
ncbi:MAG TPA: tetratricopeptide repeat protein [Gemmatimonadaceae bacterium]|nr:tetratricopeptide repeat protein [Gemmatimonadaceae bacterium]